MTATVLTVNQPYAGLILRAIKWTEIRTQRKSYTGDLYIHANKWADDAAWWKANYPAVHIEWELGLLGKVQMLGCVSGPALESFANGEDMTEHEIDLVTMSYLTQLRDLHTAHDPNGNIYEDAGFGEREFNFLLSDPEMFDAPIPAKGKLGLWKMDIDQPTRPLRDLVQTV